MTPFQHILVPVDFGDAMQPGIDLAVTLARKFEARITLVNAFDLTPFTTMTPLAPMLDVEPAIVASEAELEEAARDDLEPTGQRPTPIFRRGTAYEAILAVAKDQGCDLIVLGTHGRRGVARLLLGSVAERIVRLSPIPVLTVHPAPAVEKAASAA